MSKYADIEQIKKVIRTEWVKYMPTELDVSLSFVLGKISELPTIEVSEDCISREYVRAKFDYISYAEKDPITIAKRIVDNAPSAVPTTEQSSTVGEWQITDAYPHNVYCSECHKKFAQTHWAVWEDGSLPRNYCPNCGAKMEE